jgi:hypothetical protein
MMSWPVVNAAPGELSQSTALAISSGVPMRPAGVCVAIVFFTDVDIADLMVVLDHLLGGEQAELALGAGVVERDVQSAVGADGLFDERDDVILSGDIGLYEQGASTGRSDLPGDLLSLGNPPAGDPSKHSASPSGSAATWPRWPASPRLQKIVPAFCQFS